MSERNVRVAGEVQRILSDLIRELKDPRKPQMMSITGVKVTKDLSVATVYYSVLGGEEDKDKAKTVLDGSAGFLRRELGKRLRLRKVPELRLRLDETIEYGFAMDALIDRVISADEKNRADRENRTAGTETADSTDN
ncbi:MAG: 30S ribosome-binding factor RbfA [Saccharofermentanales bacterium]|jgi:ribosome-binding factor A